MKNSYTVLRTVTCFCCNEVVFAVIALCTQYTTELTTLFQFKLVKYVMMLVCVIICAHMLAITNIRT